MKQDKQLAKDIAYWKKRYEETYRQTEELLRRKNPEG